MERRTIDPLVVAYHKNVPAEERERRKQAIRQAIRRFRAEQERMDQEIERINQERQEQENPAPGMGML